jgi:tetratricopeptide (TPR) repeat protein
VFWVLVPQNPQADLQGLVAALTSYMVTANLLLGLFNLLPFPPLDGFQALVSLYALVRGTFGPSTEHPASPQQVGMPAGGRLEDDGVESGDRSASPAEIHLQIALQYHKDGQIDEAIARYRQALAHDPNMALAYYNEGLAYWSKGRFSLASSAFRAALRTGTAPLVRAEADQRLRELGQAEHDPAAEAAFVPPLLEPGSLTQPFGDGVPAPDPTTARREWLRLAVGGLVSLSLAALTWVAITAATLTIVQD